MTIYFNDTYDLVQQLRSVVDELFDSNQDHLAERILGVSRQIMGHTILGGLPPSNILQDIVNLLNDCNISFSIIGAIAVTYMDKVEQRRILTF